MQGTQKLHPVSVASQGRVGTPIAIAFALVLVGLSYLLFVTQPGLLATLNAAFAHVAPQGRAPSWLVPGLGAVIAMLGVALGTVLLSAFIQGVQTAPYAWLSPLLVGFSSVVLGRMRLELPLDRLSPAAFAVLSGLLLLGGGALLQARRFPARLAGGVALVLPLLTLGVGYARVGGNLASAVHALDLSAGMFLFVLALTSLGVALVAFTGRPTRSAREVAARARTWDQHRDQLAQALDRLRETEMRAAEAERRAQVAEYNLQVQGASTGMQAGFASGRRDNTEEFVTLARPPIMGSKVALGLGAVALLGAAFLVAYVGAYRPLVRRAAVQTGLANEAAKEHAQEIDALRKHFEDERQALFASLAGEREKSASVLATAEETRKQPAAEQAVAADAPAATGAVKATADNGAKAAVVAHRVATKPVPARPAKHAIKTVAAKSAHATAAKRGAATEASGAASSDKAEAPVLREKVNDDPIGGLEGM